MAPPSQAGITVCRPALLCLPNGGLSEAAHILFQGIKMLICKKQLLTTSLLSAQEMKAHIEAFPSHDTA